MKFSAPFMDANWRGPGWPPKFAFPTKLRDDAGAATTETGAGETHFE